MITNIQEVKDNEVLSWIQDFEDKGGRLSFNFYKIARNYEGKKPNKYYSHLMVARQTIEYLNYKANQHFNKFANTQRNQYPRFQIDFNDLDASGIKINVEEFLGPFYDLKTKSPIIRGRIDNSTMNSYFFYNQEEIASNSIDKNSRIENYLKKYPENNGNFVYAFLEPPYTFMSGSSLKERGDYLNNFMSFAFSDINKIKIMKWSTNCSEFFDAGKEWWGAYFWTVYNPEKDWFIGICGSDTD